MVIDSIENAGTYLSLSGGLRKALDYLRRGEHLKLAPGKYPIDGERVYAMVQEYQTKPRASGLWEAHRKYLDVQFVQSGVELMGWSRANGLSVSREYNADEDYLLYDGRGAGEFVRLDPGMFTIFWPQDAHMPTLAVDDRPVAVRKVVIKVACE